MDRVHLSGYWGLNVLIFLKPIFCEDLLSNRLIQKFLIKKEKRISNFSNEKGVDDFNNNSSFVGRNFIL